MSSNRSTLTKRLLWAIIRNNIYLNFLQNCGVDERKCTHIECDIRRLDADKYILIELYSRLWLQTLDDAKYLNDTISSFAIVYVGNDRSSSSDDHHRTTVTTLLNRIDSRQPKRPPLPWWIYVIAILVGLIILVLLTLCLWKVCK